MKKILCVLVCFLIVYCAGCGKKTETKNPEQPVTEEIIDFNKEQPEEGTPGAAQTAGTVAQETAQQELMASYESLTPTQEQEALKQAGFYQGKVDGAIGPMTKKAIEDFQLQNNLTVTGKVDMATWEKLRSYGAPAAQGASVVPSEAMMSGKPSSYETPTVKEIQEALKNAKIYQGNVDGVLGPMTKKSIEDFQVQNGLVADGKVGPKTWAKLRPYLVATEAPQTAPAAPEAQTGANQ
ncbi:MAG: peptidoglycan-binding protein [Candidatus Omnitrophica bacterium]|nr:peptidoglycan-binding protein [Candidatus Omnitrophota bacterium]